MSQVELQTLLETIHTPATTSSPIIDSMSIELDCCVIPLRNDLNLIQTVDFFYALIDDPYTMGRITCCNVLSDLYAMGVVDCDNLLLLVGVPDSLLKDERMVVNKMLFEGFRDCATEAGTSIRGGQTVFNPWLMLGGVATSVSKTSEYIMPNQVREGDVLVLTKPLGTQLATNAYGWLTKKSADQRFIESAKLKRGEIIDLLQTATLSMARLNRFAASLMHKYKAHGCTDVTGFGPLGHADNLARLQSDLAFRLHSLPCLETAVRLSIVTKDRYNLLKGTSPETSGGLLIALPSKEAAIAFCKEISGHEPIDKIPGQTRFAENQYGEAWIVGEVVRTTDVSEKDIGHRFSAPSDNKSESFAYISNDSAIKEIEVPSFEGSVEIQNRLANVFTRPVYSRLPLQQKT